MIVSNSNLEGEDKICCLVTSNKSKDGILISRSSFDVGKLPFKSWIKPHRIFTVDERFIIKTLAKVNGNFCGCVKDKITYFIE